MWIETKNQTPPHGEVVNTMDSGGNTQTLKYEKPLWWFPDGSMYVYYTPMRWEKV